MTSGPVVIDHSAHPVSAEMPTEYGRQAAHVPGKGGKLVGRKMERDDAVAKMQLPAITDRQRCSSLLMDGVSHGRSPCHGVENSVLPGTKRPKDIARCLGLRSGTDDLWPLNESCYAGRTWNLALSSNLGFAACAVGCLPNMDPTGRC